MDTRFRASPGICTSVSSFSLSPRYRVKAELSRGTLFANGWIARSRRQSYRLPLNYTQKGETEMRMVFYHGHFDTGKGKRIHRATVMKILQSNLDALKRQGRNTADEAMADIETDSVLKMPDGSELWQEEA